MYICLMLVSISILKIYMLNACQYLYLKLHMCVLNACQYFNLKSYVLNACQYLHLNYMYVILVSISF